MLKKLFARIAYHLDTSVEVPARKVRDAMSAEGWAFKESPYGSTLIDHPSFNTQHGQKSLEVVTTETISSIYISGTPEQIDSYKTAKKRIAAQAHGLAP